MGGSARKDGRLAWWVLAAIVAGAAALYLVDLGERRLMGDEFMAAEMGRESIGEILRLSFVEVIDPAYSRNRPAFHVVAWATTRLVDDLELSARLPAALGGLVAVWAMFLLGRAAYVSRGGGTREGLAAAALLAGGHSFVWASTEALGYAPMVACVVLAYLGGVRATRSSGDGSDGGRRWWALAGAATALGYYFHPIATLPAGGLLLAIAILGVRARAWRGLAACFGAGFVVMLPALSNLARLVWWSEGPGGSGRFLDDRGMQPLSLTRDGFHAGREAMEFLGPGTTAGFVVAAALAILGFAVSVRRERFAAWTALLLVAAPLVFLTTVSLGHGWAVRYLLFLLVPLALMQARAAVFLVERLPLASGARAVLVAVLAALLVGWNVPRWRDDGVYIEQDWRGTAEFFLGRTHGETLLIAGLTGGRLMDTDFNLLNLGRPELIFYFDEEEPRFHYTTAGVDSPVRWPFENPDFRLDCAGGVLVHGLHEARPEDHLVSHPVDVVTLAGLSVLVPSDATLDGFVQLAEVLVALVHCGPHPDDAQQMMLRALDSMLRAVRDGAVLPDGFLDRVGAHCSRLDPRKRMDDLLELDERLVELGGTLDVDAQARIGRAHLLRCRDCWLAGQAERSVNHFLRAAECGLVTPDVAATFEEKLRAAGEDAQAERLKGARVVGRD